MHEASAAAAEGRWTRRRLLRLAAAGGAVAAGGAAIGARGGDGTSFAAALSRTDAEILNMFLLLERVQQAFYRAALERTHLTGELLTYANAAAKQEDDHVKFLTRRLGGRADAAPQTDFGAVLASPKTFRDAAVELEEAAIAAYIGQGANLSRATVGDVAVLVSVEARQVAWVRDIAGVSPAPRAADPARKPSDVMAELRTKGLLR
jgi:ferritin-like protein